MIDTVNDSILLTRRPGLLLLIIDVMGREFVVQKISIVNIIAIIIEKSY